MTSDPRYKSQPFLSQICSIYQEQDGVASLVLESQIERMVKVEFDTVMGITSFAVQPIWFIKGGYDSPERPPAGQTQPDIDLFRFKGKIYQMPTNSITTGWSMDRKIYFELHMQLITNDFQGAVFKNEDNGKIFKYEASRGALKFGLHVLEK